MIIKTLAENVSFSEEFDCEHGLSLYIETARHKILFDTGKGELFVVNAFLLDAELSDVDIAVISHGHNDHGGGLKTFLLMNDKAPVYISSKAFEKHYAYAARDNYRFIGLDIDPEHTDRFIYAGKQLIIDDELELFSDVPCERLNPSGNADLYKEANSVIVPDDFTHEQNLVIRSDGKTVLVAGCAHCGIVNILEHYHNKNGSYPDTVIGGFHLYNLARDQYEAPEVIKEIGAFLLHTQTKFYTCHCTGLEAYHQLKDIMGDAIAYLSCGQTLNI